MIIQRGWSKNSLDSTGIEDGAIYFVAEDGGFYIDVNSTLGSTSYFGRIKVNDKVHTFTASAFTSSNGKYQYHLSNLRNLPYKVEYEILLDDSNSQLSDDEIWSLQSALGRANITCSYNNEEKIVNFNWDIGVLPASSQPIKVRFYLIPMEMVED